MQLLILSPKSSLAIIGEGDTSTVTIKSPVDIELTNGGNVSFQKVHLTAKTSTGRGVVDIKSSKTTVSFSESKITIEGRERVIVVPGLVSV
mgnify:CR=1 FL=1